MSTENAQVICGEASESDIEDGEPSISNLKIGKNTGLGLAVDGEAPESDDDEIVSYTKLCVSNDVEDANIYPETYVEKRSYSSNSLLQKKLCEVNTSLWKDLTNFVQSSFVTTSKHLVKTEQNLIKSQVVLQSTSYNLKMANSTTTQILDKARDALTVHFIPDIQI